MGDRQRVQQPSAQQPSAQPHRRAVLFDLYGTLVDLETDEKSIAFWHGLAAQLGTTAERIGGGSSDDDHHAMRLRSRFRSLCAIEARRHGEGNVLDHVFAQLLGEAGRPATTADVRSFAHQFRRGSVTRLSLRPYARPLLARLRDDGARTGLVSNTEALLTWDDIEQLHIRDLFDRIVLSSEVRTQKPDPSILHMALAELDTTPSNAVMVGDTWETDIEAGLAAGMHVVCLDPGAGPGTPEVDEATGVLRAHPDLDSCVLALQALGFLGHR